MRYSEGLWSVCVLLGGFVFCSYIIRLFRVLSVLMTGVLFCSYIIRLFRVLSVLMTGFLFCLFIMGLVLVRVCTKASVLLP